MKKRKESPKWLAKIETDDCTIRRTGTIGMDSGLLLRPSRRQSKSGVPQEMILELNHDAGIFFGTSSQLDTDCYVGMPQGADGNIIVIGGNGSGKSSGIAKPTLRSWQGAICATDIKGELSQAYENLYQWGLVTRPYIIFDPMNEEGPSYDPLLWLTEDAKENLISNIWEITLAIIPILPDDKQPFWAETEQGVLAAALLHYFNQGLSFSEILCKIESQSISLLCEHLSESTDIRVKMFLGQTASLKGETLATIDRGLRNKLMLFVADPYISHAFRGEREGARCFSWDDLEGYNIFLRIPSDRIEQWSGAVNLIYTQLIRCLERRSEQHSPAEKGNIQTLLLMDEFARFGKLEMITDAMATLRSKNVNICLVIQSIAQLDKLYGEHDRRIIFDNCQYQAILRANDAETQEYLSRLNGTCIRRQHSIGEHLNENMNTIGYNKHISEVRELQVFPHELSTLENVLLLTPSGVCHVDKLRRDSDLAAQLMFDLPSLHSWPGQLASIDEPGYFPPKNLIENEGAKMLTIQERNKNASRRFTASQHQQRVAQRQEREAKEKANRLRNYIVGEMVVQFFPELESLEPGTKEENEVTFRPLKSFLIELASDQELVERFKERAQYQASEAGVFDPRGRNA